MRRSASFIILLALSSLAHALPPGFVYLHDVAPDIQQDMRYAGSHNFTGKPVKGYHNPTCIVTSQAAEALKAVQKALRQQNLSLKVYDCYRPTQAVDVFMTWSKDPSQQQNKAEFYPAVNKADVFALGYVAARSGHSRGSTVDLTIVPYPPAKEADYHPGQPLVACTADYKHRFRDNSIDMGTGYDCMDERSFFTAVQIDPVARANRHLLRSLMMQQGFVPYDKEWWHFTLDHEPYPNHYFNFEVE